MASAGLSRVHTGPVSRMEIEKWLGEEFEDGVIVVKLPTTYALALQMAVATSAIKPEDVPGDVVLDDAQLLYVTALLQSIVDDVLVGAAAKEAGLKIGAADRMRFKKWMELRYSSEEDVMLETPSKALSEGEQTQLKADLNAQGMESLSELSWFTLTIHGGRAATSAGTAGACYMQSPGEMPGGVLLRKAKARNYPEVLKDAETSLSAKEHDSWIAGLVERLETAPSAYAKNASLLLLKVHQRCRETLRDEAMYMAYWIKHYAKHEGRGYPGGSEMDPLILSSVMADKIARAGGGLPKTLGDFASGGSTTGGSSSSGGSSVAGSSVSSGGMTEVTELLRALSGKIDSSSAALDSRVSDISSKLDGVSRRVQSIESKSGMAARTPTCDFCGLEGHVKANCPTHSAKNVLKQKQ